MRLLLVISAVTFLCMDTASGQSQKYSPVQNYAPSPAQTPPGPAAAPQEQQPQGYYAAPPAAGTFAGPSNSVGVNGFALHFPAMTLKLPTLELPSLFRMRSQPKVLLDAAQAPFVQQQQAPAVGAPVAVQAIVEPSRQADDGDRARGLDQPTQKGPYQKNASLDSNRDAEIAELRKQVARLAASLEGLAALAHRQHETTDLHRTSYNQPVRVKRLPSTNDAANGNQAFRETYSFPSANHREPIRIDDNTSELRFLPSTR